MSPTALRRWLSFKVKHWKSCFRGRVLALFGRHAAGIFVEAPWGLMLVDPRDGHVSRQFLRAGQYNQEEVRSLLRLLNPTDRMLIVGGHIGGVAIPLSKHVQSLDVVEASPAHHRLLLANVALAGVRNVTVHHWAASDDKGDLEFLISSENSGGSKRRPTLLRSNYDYDNPVVVKVPAYRLDEKLESDFDVILLDIEGSEYSAIKGARRLITQSRIFVFEFIPDHLTNVAGIALSEFLQALPLGNFSRAILPRHGKDLPVSELPNELGKLFDANDYEDGVVLLKEH